uniref:Reverse transcriptase Ty1/copia-type domain-containing protein n=1 Tax=Cajanus cajan TaxID=3821 RepID=A0A151U826_CAJCA|nr:hypothetical protein KK1_008108 [Cajanus cajan]
MKDLGILKYFLGIEVARGKDGLFLSRRKYVLDIISEAGLLGARPVSTPMEQNKKKKEPIVSRSSVEAKYRSMAGTTCELKWLKSLLACFRI